MPTNSEIATAFYSGLAQELPTAELIGQGVAGKPKQAEWVELIHFPAIPSYEGLGFDSQGPKQGFFNLACCTRSGVGVLPAQRLAESVAVAMAKGRVILDGVRVVRVELMPPTTFEGRSCCSVAIYYSH